MQDGFEMRSCIILPRSMKCRKCLTDNWTKFPSLRLFLLLMLGPLFGPVICGQTLLPAKFLQPLWLSIIVIITWSEEISTIHVEKWTVESNFTLSRMMLFINIRTTNVVFLKLDDVYFNAEISLSSTNFRHALWMVKERFHTENCCIDNCL